jgi:hypothetical protein
MQGPPGSLYGEDAAVFAGFTSTPITGAIGSREQMHASCAATFAGSHLCHIAEYGLASSATPVPAAGAWIDSSGAVGSAFTGGVVIDEVASRNSGRYTGREAFGNCDDWTTTSTLEGLVLQPGGAFLGACSATHVLACCASPARERFRGFTTATTTGAAGGRAQMHFACAQEFSGSHLCHVAEYQRAGSTIAPPSTGAWVDASGYVTPQGGVIETSVASSQLGRWTSRGSVLSSTINCENWTEPDPGGGVQGLTLQPTGAFLVSCSLARPLACCD